MGPALELLLLLFLGIAVVVGGLLFFTRPLWKRAVKVVVERDRCEREVLEAQARERANEAECRRRAEEELQRALKGEDVPVVSKRRPEAKVEGKAKMPCSETKEEMKRDEIQTGEHR